MMKEFFCQQPWQRVQIRSNGEVCPCCAFFSTELSLGNIKDKSIYELWNGEQMRNLRNIHKEGRYAENPWCKKCVNGVCGISNDSDLIQINNS